MALAQKDTEGYHLPTRAHPQVKMAADGYQNWYKQLYIEVLLIYDDVVSV